MRILKNQKEIERAERFLGEAAKEARKATCTSRRCGSVIVTDNNLIGKGYNSPPANLETQRRCGCDKGALDRKVTDKTCCVHAEVRALHDALRTNSERMQGADLYFTAIDQHNHQLQSGEPYCTLCSKLSLDLGIKSWILARPQGIIEYSAREYNELSYQFSEKK